MNRGNGEQWLSTQAVTAEFAVSAAVLELYSARGSLPSSVDSTGQHRFQAQAVAAVFRRRSELGGPNSTASLGQLGQVLLGEGAATAGPDARPQTERRLVRDRSISSRPCDPCAAPPHAASDIVRYAV